MSFILLQIDKSGMKITDKDYSIVVLKDKKFAFGYNIPQMVKDRLKNDFKKGLLRIGVNKKGKKRFLLRFSYIYNYIDFKENI